VETDENGLNWNVDRKMTLFTCQIC